MTERFKVVCIPCKVLCKWSALHLPLPFLLLVFALWYHLCLPCKCFSCKCFTPVINNRSNRRHIRLKFCHIWNASQKGYTTLVLDSAVYNLMASHADILFLERKAWRLLQVCHYRAARGQGLQEGRLCVAHNLVICSQSWHTLRSTSQADSINATRCSLARPSASRQLS